MNGAEALVATLADNGVTACFANPGTSEMHLVAALGREPRVRSVLGLFEGVCTGAADGFGRMAGRPAATLLHLGPGLANGSANLHNARRAGSPVVNIVGDHAGWHREADAPLASDIESLARPNARWVRTATDADDAARLAAEAVAASQGPPAGPATLILPADCAWTEARGPGPRLEPVRRAQARGVEDAARAIRAARRPVVLVGGTACGERGVAAMARLHAAGVRVLTDTFTGRQARGAGRWEPPRMKYYAEMALADLEGVDLMLLCETTRPVAFFAYPDKPSVLVPGGCEVRALAEPDEDGTGALEALAEALGAPAAGSASSRAQPGEAAGPLHPKAIGDSLARWLPEGAVVSDEAITASQPILQRTAGAAPHDWLGLLGGSIGQGIPLAVGAATACPDRKVVCLVGDGSAAYTLQALWTAAREGLDLTVVVLANGSYRILNMEMDRTGASASGDVSGARPMLEIGAPRVDWTALARGFGVPGVRAEDAAELDSAFARAMAEPGPHLIEAVLG
jgi:acetolactate synthase-1/2/3 large subunit